MAKRITAQKKAITAVESRLAELRDRLIETATEINAGLIHPAHVANRLRKMAREIGGK